MSIFCGILATPLGAPAKADPMAISLPEFLPVGEAAQPPYGWAGYCERYSSECGLQPATIRSLDLNQNTWGLMVAVNDWVNNSIRPETDWKHWGLADRWDDPTDGYGDCEDIAILKQQILISLGVPEEALLLTVVWDKDNEGHAVLTAHTTQGDYILDNKTREILIWSQTAYDFVKRQSQSSPNQWVYVDGLRWPPSTTAACAANRCGQQTAQTASLLPQSTPP